MRIIAKILLYISFSREESKANMDDNIFRIKKNVKYFSDLWPEQREGGRKIFKSFYVKEDIILEKDIGLFFNTPAQKITYLMQTYKKFRKIWN